MLAFFAIALLFGTAYESNAQGNSRWAHEKNRVRKEQKAIQKAEKKAYRLQRGQSFYETDQRGVDLIRRAIGSGYQQGVLAGRSDRRDSRRSDYRDESLFRSGTYGYQSYVDRDQYQHYFREGFERGYRDGYTDQPTYGSNTGGKWSILGTVLNNILNLR
jgi:hypothetical protein